MTDIAPIGMLLPIFLSYGDKANYYYVTVLPSMLVGLFAITMTIMLSALAFSVKRRPEQKTPSVPVAETPARSETVAAVPLT
jgi:uncharacterized protein (DUF58 family)